MAKRKNVISARSHAQVMIIVMVAKNSSAESVMKEGWICLSNRILSKYTRRKNEKRKKGETRKKERG